MRSHPWFLWRRKSAPAPAGAPGNYRGHMPWFRYSVTNIVEGKLCIGAITMTIPGMALTVAVPGMTTTMATPGMTIAIEDCD